MAETPMTNDELLARVEGLTGSLTTLEQLASWLSEFADENKAQMFGYEHKRLLWAADELAIAAFLRARAKSGDGR